ncbi:MAG: hypothetical protein KF886_17245 [Candidatus Hydrogenedentes bacterium]|nr:hypothetical protein [Candidatus Hydrogenedentota bacterium]
MIYKYAGFLKTVLERHDPEGRAAAEYVEFTAEEIAHWALVDDPADREWQSIPAERVQTASGVSLIGHFEGVRPIDSLPSSDPSFWVSLSSRRSQDSRFPIDLNRYPVAEITYRCISMSARPAWVLSYRGGTHFDALEPAQSWQTAARLVQHHGFPRFIDHCAFRLYATKRKTETFEIQSIRFRGLSTREHAACYGPDSGRHPMAEAPQYPLLNEFLPLGVYMKAGTAKRMADCMEISFRDYWRFALEDIARHHHNSVAIEEIDRLTPSEWREVLGLADSYGIRVLAHHHWPRDEFQRDPDKLIDRDIRPFADSPAILGWAIQDEPPSQSFKMHVDAQARIQEADPNHPLAAIHRDTTNVPLFGPHFPVTGISHFKSHAPWELGDTVREHYPLARGQQLWVVAPAFVFSTDTPEWNTSPEMRLMINLAFASGARGWFAFVYHNDPIWVQGNTQRSLTGPFLNFSDNWAELGHRVERFFALAPLVLNATPCAEPEDCPFKITWQEHSRSQRPEGVPAIQWSWLAGSDYRLLYVISNELTEVTTVYIEAPDSPPAGLEAYDVSDFVRSRLWSPMPWRRHLEMFPGQGQVILLATNGVAERWRDEVALRLQEQDRRQIALDLSLARRYNLDIREVHRKLRQAGTGSAMEEAQRSQEAREHLVNLLYHAPALASARTNLIGAGAALCACDGALCRLLGNGRVDPAFELGQEVLPLARRMARLRLNVRRNHDVDIISETQAVTREALALMDRIRAVR